MKEIKFKSKFLQLVENNKKTQTIRFWNKCLLKINEQIILNFGSKKLVAKIENITINTFNNLTDEEIKNDGFEDKNVLLKELKTFYPSFNEITSNLYIIKFKLND